MACVIKMKSPHMCQKGCQKNSENSGWQRRSCSLCWSGAVVDISYTLSAGLSAVLMIFVALLFRSVGGITLCGRNTSDMERTVILCDRLSPKGNGAGGNWFCSFGGRTFLWKNCSVCRCACNHHHSSTWGNRDGCRPIKG